MSLELIIQILQVGFSGFVFLMALLSYKLIRKEQDRTDKPRTSILSELKSFRNWAMLSAVLVLLSPIIEKIVTAKVSEEKVIIKEVEKPIPNIQWSYTIPDSQNTGIFQCTANGKKVGTPVNCKSYNSCGVKSLNDNVCRGLFYKEAINISY